MTLPAAIRGKRKTAGRSDAGEGGRFGLGGYIRSCCLYSEYNSKFSLIGIRGLIMLDIFKRLLKVSSVKEVTDLLEIIIDKYNINWTPVGGRSNNIATINIGTDPAAGLTERITNAIDAVLELEWCRNGNPKDIASPRLAAELWFDLPPE